LEGQLAYWKDKLADLSTLELPGDRPRPLVPSNQGAHLDHDLPASLTRKLKELSQREGATFFMTLLAAFQLLLHRYSGQEDIAVATTVAGRGRPEFEGLIGFFVNTLVLRSNLADNPTFTQLLTRVRETALSAYTHQDLPFEKLVEELSPERNINRNPLFDAIINYIDGAEPALDLFGLVTEQFALPSVSAKFAMTLDVRPQADSVGLRLIYQTELFSPARIESILEQYVYLLEQIATAPTKSINTYSLITARARAFLPDPRAPIEVRPQQCILTEVMNWARSTPERVAVSVGSADWTYAELTGRAASLSSTLREIGIGRGDVVAIMGPRGFELVATMLGILMSGGAFLTIDPTLPAQRKKVMLREARVKLLCLIGSFNKEDRHLGIDGTLRVLQVDPDPASRAEDPRWPDRAWSMPTIQEDDPAYVFFTSGSTGQPKAILGCHKALSHFLHWQRDTFMIGPEDRVSQLTGLLFDPFLRDVFLPLTSGARLCLPTENDLLDTIGWLKRERITVVNTGPTVLQSWLFEPDEQVELEDLRWLFLSGEPLTDALIGKWRRRISGSAQLVNLYGPTETTMVRCFYPIPPEVTQGVQPVGSSLPETQALVLNSSGSMCGIGEIGEIVLRTPYRSLGYLNLPKESELRFRPNPFRNDESDLIFFTGDRGRYRADGLLEIAGRVDDQVKIRGVLVHPGEVTAALARHEAVSECFVLARQDKHGQHQLVGYAVAHKDKHLDAHDLRAYLSDQLPQALVPSTFVFLNSLPVLPNGKVDRRALPAPEGRSVEDSNVAPRTPTEKALANIWCDVLDLKQVGVNDNFFELGGHSLLAAQVISRVRNVLKTEIIVVRSIFEKPTIASLAKRID
ncbi:MAG: amino acid adenylation domain-containing protein, partial [Pseudolabrys sp.]